MNSNQKDKMTPKKLPLDRLESMTKKPMRKTNIQDVKWSKRV